MSAKTSQPTPARRPAFRRRSLGLPIAGLALLAFGASLSVRAEGLTALTLAGDVGTYPGNGKQLSFTASDGTFTASIIDGHGVKVSFTGASEWWTLNFVGPAGSPLTPGVYDGALAYPFQPPTKPGLDVSGDYASCGASVTGRFVVLEAGYGGTGDVVSFAADFEQHCLGTDPALFGSVRYNSTVGLGLRVSVGPTATYEGDGEARNLAFRVALSARTTAPVDVGYTTADGTAKAAVDYTTVSGTAHFGVGDVALLVDVPVLGNTVPQADRSLTLSLAELAGASIGFGQGTGTILDDDSGRTFIHLDSEPGDYIGDGQSLTRTPLDGTLTAASDAGGVGVSFSNGLFDWWDLHFAPPSGQQLSPGVYEGATRYPFQSPTGPGLDVGGDGNGCNTLLGRFVVLEAQYGPTGDVQRLAVDFEQHCEWAPPALFGSVRFNSTVGVGPRISVAPAAGYEGDGERKSLTFWVSLSAPASVPVSVAYATADGTARAGIDYAAWSGTVHFAAGETGARVDVPVLGNTVPQPDRTFTLSLSDPVGAPIAFGQASGRIVDDDSSRTFIYLQGDAGDYVVGDRNLTMTPLDHVISATSFEDGVQVEVAGGALNSWYLVFVGRSGEVLTPGVYEGATGYGSNITYATPAFTLIGEARGCGDYTGRFVVLDAQYGPNGEVLSLAIDFESHCAGGIPAVFGTVRFSSAIRLGPRISVAPAAAYEGNGEPVSLTFWLSLSARVEVPVTVDYATADGSAKAGTDYTSVSGTASFAPGATAVRVDVPVLGNTVPQPGRAFVLSLRNPVGAPLAFGQATGTIADDDAITTLILLDSDEGDYIGLGKRVILRPLDGTISAEQSGGSTHVNFASSPLSWWDLYFAPPVGGVLAPGYYEGATRYLLQLATSPGLDVSGDGRGCNTLTGRFVVLEAEYGPAGEMRTFAVDFEQHCEGMAPALFGSVRYNSAIGVNPRLELGRRLRQHLRK